MAGCRRRYGQLSASLSLPGDCSMAVCCRLGRTVVQVGGSEARGAAAWYFQVGQCSEAPARSRAALASVWCLAEHALLKPGRVDRQVSSSLASDPGPLDWFGGHGCLAVTR
jgi:hypothetical protein